MPIKWTPENDKLLLYKILETSSVSADTKAISAAWPTDNGEIPTPRAISERLCKIRASVKARGGAHFSVSSAKTKSTNNGAPRTPTATPRKPRAKKAGSELTVTTENGDGAATKSGKRKRASANGSAHGDFTGVVANGNGVAVKVELSDEEEVGKENGFMNGNSQVEGLCDDEEESPSKRMRKLSVVAGNDGDGEADADGEADEVDDDGDDEFLKQLV
ncbi:hypothetical protein MMC30_001419 [Trapelia coarctata]|nr:hypothetical protein [Trapelia coarctata]